MGRVHQLTRRSFLTELGGGTIAIAVFGLSACSSSTDSADNSSDPPAGTTGTSNDAVTTTADGEAAPSSEAGAENASAEVGDATLAWERVNLGFVSAYVLARGNEMAVVDTGTSGSEGLILDAVETLGGSWSDVGHVIMTHAHGDHVGSVGSVLDKAATASGYIGSADLANVEAPRDLVAVDDGDEVFGLQIIGTPGHTPGHISVYDAASGLLVAGDSLNESNGEVLGANPDFSVDMGQADQSVKRLATLSFETLLVGHGEPVVGGAGQAVSELASSL